MSQVPAPEQKFCWHILTNGQNFRGSIPKLMLTLTQSTPLLAWQPVQRTEAQIPFPSVRYVQT